MEVIYYKVQTEQRFPFQQFPLAISNKVGKTFFIDGLANSVRTILVLKYNKSSALH